MVAIAVATQPSVNESSRQVNDLVGSGMSALERRRLELESLEQVVIMMSPTAWSCRFDAASARLDEATCQERTWGIAIIGRICR